MQFKVDIPYPEIKVERKDPDLAKRIFNLYAGEVSEDTAVHDYIFQMLILNDDKDLKTIFREVAITEMHHLEILGLLIKELGFTPVYVSVEDNKAKWFNTSYVNYEKNLKNILLDDIRIEEIAIKKYEEVIASTSDLNVQHILKRIILDERLHIEIFTKLYEQIK